MCVHVNVHACVSVHGCAWLCMLCMCVAVHVHACVHVNVHGMCAMDVHACVSC